LSSASTVIFFGSEACLILLSLAKEIKTGLEASGGYERGVVRALLAAAYRDDTLGSTVPPVGTGCRLHFSTPRNAG
jgi:hypothetical protein